MFYDVFSAFCAKHNVSRNRVAMDIGLSNSTVTKWKKTGATPEGATLSKLSQYFGVTIDDILGNTPESYLLVTEYLLSEAQDAYDKETDPAKKNDLAMQIDVLQESIEDQKFSIAISKETTTSAENNIQAAFFGSYADDLTPEERDGLWRDAQDFARFKAEQMRKEKKRKNG